jgi:hypothetical protein
MLHVREVSSRTLLQLTLQDPLPAMPMRAGVGPGSPTPIPGGGLTTHHP